MKLSLITEAGTTRRDFLKKTGKAGVAASTGGPMNYSKALLNAASGSGDFFSKAISIYNGMSSNSKSKMLDLYNERGGDQLWRSIERYNDNGMIVIDGEKIGPSLAMIGMIANKTDMNDPAEVMTNFIDSSVLLAYDKETTNQVLSSILSKGTKYVSDGIRILSDTGVPFETLTKMYEANSSMMEKFLGIDIQEFYAARDMIYGEYQFDDMKHWGMTDEYFKAHSALKNVISKGLVSAKRAGKFIAHYHNKKKSQKQKIERERDAERRKKEREKKIEPEKITPRPDDYLASPMHQPFESKLDKALGLTETQKFAGIMGSL